MTPSSTRYQPQSLSSNDVRTCAPRGGSGPGLSSGRSIVVGGRQEKASARSAGTLAYMPQYSLPVSRGCRPGLEPELPWPGGPPWRLAAICGALPPPRGGVIVLA